MLTARAQSAASEALAERFDELRRDAPEEIVVVPTLPGGLDDPLDSGTTVATNTVTQPAEPISFFPETSPEIGTEIGRIVISAVELDLVVFQGVDRAILKKGPGHMSWTPMPG